MEKLKQFSIAGIDKELLVEVLSTNKDFIENFDEINCFFIDEMGVLVLCHCNPDNMGKEGYTPYPFTVTVGMLAEHIMTAVSEVSEDQLESLGEAIDGYEEDYEYGWRVFIPKYTRYLGKEEERDGYGVGNYDWYHNVLAAQPKLFTYGK